MKKGLFCLFGFAFAIAMLVSCGSFSDTSVQTPEHTDSTALPSPEPSVLQAQTPSEPAQVPSPAVNSTEESPIPAIPSPILITDDEARAICNAWLDDHADLPSYSLIEWADGLYPAFDYFGEEYYAFGVEGMSLPQFYILVHIETGEALFLIGIGGEPPKTAVGLLNDWQNYEPAEVAPLLTVDDAIAVYNKWLDDHAGNSLYALERQSYEHFELFGERYYWFRADEMSAYWYNILVNMETGELLYMMISDGQFPETSIVQLDNWYDRIYPSKQ